MNKLLAGVLSVALLVPLGVEAAPYGQGPMPERAAMSAPQHTLRSGIEQLRGFLARHPHVRSDELGAFVNQTLAPYFDFNYMTRWAAGPLGRYLSPPQWNALRGDLKGMFLEAMVGQLAEHPYSRIEYLRPRGNPQTGEVVLGIAVYPRSGGYPVRIDFRLYQGENGWKVFDVMAEGSSAVAHYRELFMRLAQRYGIDGMLARLSR